jgi:hypothetical protein
VANQVVISNKRPQKIEAALKQGDKVVSLPLAPHATSKPVDRASLTDYTWGLERKGHVKIRKV